MKIGMVQTYVVAVVSIAIAAYGFVATHVRLTSVPQHLHILKSIYHVLHGVG
jgi:hypothetical protein